MSRRTREPRAGRPRRAPAVRVAVVATLLIAVVYVAALAIFNAIADGRLLAQVDSQLADTLTDAKHGAGFAAAAQPDSDDRDIDAPPVLLWRISAAGRIVAASAGAPRPPATAWPRSDRPYTTRVGTATFRLKARKTGDGWLVAGQSLADTAHIQSVLLTAEAIASPVLLAAVFLSTLAVGLKASAPVEQARRRQLEFTADASHDLRTPLALIRTNAELALRRSRSETEYRETLARILSSSEETTELIEKLLMLARADAGASQLTYQVMELGATVLQASRKAQVLALSKGVVFFEDVSTTPMFVKADHSAIETLLLSLLDNAVKYTAADGEVFLRSRQENGYALIEVGDTGIGIDASDVQKIFDRFFRADQARSREIRGSGLGLSIAQWIAEIHNGRIEVKSELGHGSVFTVRLPLTVAPAANRIPEVINQARAVAPH